MLIANDVRDKLEEAVVELTDSFCYACYRIVKGTCCPHCGCDDLMRHLTGVGVEYGTNWVVQHWLTTMCTPVDEDDYFEDMLDDCYKPYEPFGGLCFTAGQVLKAVDPVGFDVLKNEYMDTLVADGVLIEHEGKYYKVEELESIVNKLRMDKKETKQ